jgi:hypothetical protein
LVEITPVLTARRPFRLAAGGGVSTSCSLSFELLIGSLSESSSSDLSSSSDKSSSAFALLVFESFY